jgi:hypothetical protein
MDNKALNEAWERYREAMYMQGDETPQEINESLNDIPEFFKLVKNLTDIINALKAERDRWKVEAINAQKELDRSQLTNQTVYVQGKWINVADRLPDKNGNYIVAMSCDRKLHATSRKFTVERNEFGYSLGTRWERHTIGVKYWMEFPDVPKLD